MCFKQVAFKIHFVPLSLLVISVPVCVHTSSFRCGDPWPTLEERQHYLWVNRGVNSYCVLSFSLISAALFFADCPPWVCRPFFECKLLCFFQKFFCSWSSSDTRARPISRCIFRFSSHSLRVEKPGLQVERALKAFKNIYMKIANTSSTKDLFMRDAWPFVCIKVAAQSSNREESRGTVWGTIVFQEAWHVQAVVHRPGEVVWVCVNPANNLDTRPTKRKESIKWKLLLRKTLIYSWKLEELIYVRPCLHIYNLQSSLSLNATSLISFTLKSFSQPKVQVSFWISFLEVTQTFSLNKCEPTLAPSNKTLSGGSWGSYFTEHNTKGEDVHSLIIDLPYEGKKYC